MFNTYAHGMIINIYIYTKYVDVSKNRGTPKSSILIGFSIVNHRFGVPLFLETPIYTIN